ncbi:hypothetical protein LCGC14_2673960, partial [marine sediment metagenome]
KNRSLSPALNPPVSENSWYPFRPAPKYPLSEAKSAYVSQPKPSEEPKVEETVTQEKVESKTPSPEVENSSTKQSQD